MSEERRSEVESLNEFGDRLERAAVAEASRPWFVRLRRTLAISAVVIIGVPVAIAGAVELRGDPVPEGPYVEAGSCESLTYYDAIGQPYRSDYFAPECPSAETVLHDIATSEPSAGIAKMCRSENAPAETAEPCGEFLRNREQYLAGVEQLKAQGIDLDDYRGP